MKEPIVLFIKPNAVSEPDKALLQKAGVLVVEIDDPSSVKFVRATAEIDGNEMLRCASQAIRGSEFAQKAFAAAILAMIDAKSK